MDFSQQQRALFAPDAVEVNGTWHLFFCTDEGLEGVAAAPCPEGPYVDPVLFDIRGIDPAVFVDDDGAYLFWGQKEALGARLTEDMRAIDPSTIVCGVVDSDTHFFHEGSSIRRRGDIYYFVFADESRGKPTCLGYATALHPLGPYTYRGVIIDNAGCDPSTWNNHGSIEQIEGSWYVFYHRSSQNHPTMRRVCAEPISFTEDGLIPEVPMTSQGPGSPFAVGETIPAYRACMVRGGAYLAPFGATEALFVADSGCAVFRYVEVDTQVSTLRVDAQGPGRVDVLFNGQVVGSGSAEDRFVQVDIPPGLGELELRLSACRDLRLIDVELRPDTDHA